MNIKNKNKIKKNRKEKERVKLIYELKKRVTFTFKYNLNSYIYGCNCFNCTMHMYKIYTNIYRERGAVRCSFLNIKLHTAPHC